jgi:polyferredoxin
MSKLRKRLKKHDSPKQIAETVTNRLVIVIGFLVVILLVLIFRIGEIWWSSWMIAHRMQIVGFIAFIAIFLIFLSPIMVEASSHTRTLSGPGKNPKGPRLE